MSIALATGIKEGDGFLEVINLNSVAVNYAIGAWGTSTANAIANLNIIGGAATTGFVIAPVINGVPPTEQDVPDNATHVAFATGVVGETSTLMVNQCVP